MKLTADWIKARIAQVSHRMRRRDEKECCDHGMREAAEKVFWIVGDALLRAICTSCATQLLDLFWRY
jgi:hypothetical protein